MTNMPLISSFVILAFRLASVLSIDCQTVRQNNDGFRIGVRIGDQTRKYRLFDKKGNEWDFNVTKVNGQMDFYWISHQSSAYDLNVINTFGSPQLEINCNVSDIGVIIGDNITCRTSDGHSADEQFTHFVDPLILRAHPKNDNINYFLAINRQNKSERFRIDFNIGGDLKIDIRSDGLQDMEFVNGMSDSMFAKLDSMVDYNWDQQTSGWILWFNIDGKNLYCNQPEAQKLSPNCSSEENLKNPFGYCGDISSKDFLITETPKRDINILLILAVILIITNIFAIIGIVYYSNTKNRRYEKNIAKKSGSNDTSDQLTDQINKRLEDKTPMKVQRFKTSDLEKEFLGDDEKQEAIKTEETTDEDSIEPKTNRSNIENTILKPKLT